MDTLQHPSTGVNFNAANARNPGSFRPLIREGVPERILAIPKACTRYDSSPERGAEGDLSYGRPTIDALLEMVTMLAKSDDLDTKTSKERREAFAAEARKAALEVFHKDCLIRLGTCLTPVGNVKNGTIILKVILTLSNGEKIEKDLMKNQLFRIKLDYEPIEAELFPHKKMDIGAGNGESISTTIYGGLVGLILDGRDRPITIPNKAEERLKFLEEWSDALDEYPKKG
mgnify:CR=1 FL=1